MSKPKKPKQAKLVIGLFMNNKGLLEDVAYHLAQSFGPPDIISPWFPFDHTEYYTKEMGRPLFRRMISFSKLIEQDMIPQVKLFTNQLEEAFSDEGKRRVNIDPGYLVAERFVLATGKNYTHRIYLKDGIYADLTLIYHKGSFRPLQWTYPDYAQENVTRFLLTVRTRYLYQLKNIRTIGHNAS
nr:DUF4416 family protein [Desulfobacterales bacterium]